MDLLPLPRPTRSRRLALLLAPLLAGLLLAPAGPAAAAPPASPVAGVHAAAEADAPFAALVPPVVTGEPVVGQVLTVAPPTWSVEGVETTYQWYRDADPITGATNLAVALEAADVARVISVVATGRLAGAEPVESSSTIVGPVARIPSVAKVVGATSPGPGQVRLNVTVDAAETAGGTVEVRRGGEPLGSAEVLDGRAVVALAGQPAGDQSYTVAYLGTGRVAPSDDAVRVVVLDQATILTKATSSGVGRVALAIRVTASGGTPTGAVTVKEGSRTWKSGIALSGGRATWSATGQKPGRHTYRLVYSGSSTVARATSRVVATVKDKATPALEVRASSTSVGQVKLTVSVRAAGRAASGTVTVTEGSKTRKSGIKLSGGRATWSASGQEPGRHTYTVRYSGSSTVKSSTAKVSVTVKNKVKPSVKPTASSPAAGKVRLRVTVTASGQRGLGGSVKIKEGSKTRKAKVTVRNGTASWSASKVKPGRHTYTVLYSGTSQVRSGSAKVSVTVKKKKSAPAVVEYANCTELNAVHPHGVGRSGARDEVRGDTDPVTDFLVSTPLYNANDKSDRDKDGVACEKQ